MLKNTVHCGCGCGTWLQPKTGNRRDICKTNMPISICGTGTETTRRKSKAKLSFLASMLRFLIVDFTNISWLWKILSIDSDTSGLNSSFTWFRHPSTSDNIIKVESILNTCLIEINKGKKYVFHVHVGALFTFICQQ